MRGSSSTFYIVAAIIIIHFIVGFIYIIIKMSPKSDNKENTQKHTEIKNNDRD